MGHSLPHVTQAVQSIDIKFADNDETKHISSTEHLGIGVLTI